MNGYFLIDNAIANLPIEIMFLPFILHTSLHIAIVINHAASE